MTNPPLPIPPPSTPPAAASLNPEPPRAWRLLGKWRMLTIFWIVQALVLLCIGTIWQIMAENVDGPKGVYLGTLTASGLRNLTTGSEWVMRSLTIIAAMTLGQALLVWPVAKPRATRERGWPLLLSLIAAGAGVTTLAAAFALFLGEFVQRFKIPLIDDDFPIYWLLGAWCVICWLMATPLLWRFSVRRLNAGMRHEDLLGLIAARLFTGTIIEIAAIIPLDVMVRRKETCYCWSGTFFALSLCGGLGLILLGPMVLFPLLARRRKRYYAGLCDACGYDLRSLMDTARTIDRCPECGAGWRAQRANHS